MINSSEHVTMATTKNGFEIYIKIIYICTVSVKYIQNN